MKLNKDYIFIVKIGAIVVELSSIEKLRQIGKYLENVYLLKFNSLQLQCFISANHCPEQVNNKIETMHIML